MHLGDLLRTCFHFRKGRSRKVQIFCGSRENGIIMPTSDTASRSVSLRRGSAASQESIFKNLERKERVEDMTKFLKKDTHDRNHSHTYSQKHAHAHVHAHGITAPCFSTSLFVFFLIILLNVTSLLLFSRRVPQQCLNRNQMTKREQKKPISG